MSTFFVHAVLLKFEPNRCRIGAIIRGPNSRPRIKLRPFSKVLFVKRVVYIQP